MIVSSCKVRRFRPHSFSGLVVHGALLLGSLGFALGCDTEPAELPDAELQDPVTGLTPMEEKEVLVVVGDKKITLGDYATTLLRMDKFERLRYQTEERQKELLDEMIEVELLAQEAKRRGLDKDEKLQLRLRQALRDEVLRDLERTMPDLESFSERDVREYYDSHRSEFKEPERRRVQVIVISRKDLIEGALEEVQEGSGETWAEAARKYSVERDDASRGDLGELTGDRGFVSAPGVKRGANEDVPEAVRAAVFELKKVGDIVERAIEADSKFYIVKLAGISAARDRSVSDADRTIRVELRRQKFLKAEKEFEAELRKKYPVVIDEKAIASFQASRAKSETPAPAKKK